MRFAWSLLACGCLAAGFATAATPAGKLSPAARAKTNDTCHAGDAGFFRDQALTMRLATKLQFNKALLREKINVKVSSGVATLSGGLSTPEHIATALDLAAEIEGIACINNFLRVGPPDPDPDPNNIRNR